jgi:ribulose 1,5-bisphosphate synthetase/thiazole synthase
MADTGVRFARLPETLFFWRDHPERATRIMNEYALTAFRACKLHHLLHGYLHKTNDIIIAGAGQEGRAWQRILAEKGIKVTHWIEVDNRKIGTILHGAPVVSTQHILDLSNRILVAIGVRGAREQFRTLVQPLGLKEGVDFICVA